MFSEKYRIQSDNYESIWLILAELLFRLEKTNSSRDLVLSYKEDLGTQEYFALIDKSFEVGIWLCIIFNIWNIVTELQYRKQREKLKEILSQKSAQFRTVEKQLLIKSKDLNCPPFTHVEDLLDITYGQVICVVSQNIL